MNNHIRVWKPISGLENPKELSIPELRSLFKIWNELKEQLRGNDLYEEFLNKWARRWSIETGILERIYDITRGTTEMLIEQGFDASLIAHGETDRDSEAVVDFLNDHFEAHEFLMDFIGGTRLLSVSFIRELHCLIVRHQNMTIGINGQGSRITVPLIKGEWKKQPNNPTRADGSIVIYCPPEQTASEMDNLIRFYREIPVEYPEIRAAWLHHRFTQIHPFQDGNGRVARCLANIDFIKSGGFPIIVQREERSVYLDALEEADEGSLFKLIKLFARLQKNAFLQAISISQETISKDSALETILDAAERRIETRKRTRREQTDEIAAEIQVRTTSFLEEQGKIIEQRLKNVLLSLRINVMKSQFSEMHYYRRQIFEIAKCFNYWIDFRESRYWVKMAVRDGNNSNFVVILHQVGRPSQGTGVAISFIEFLDTEDDAEEINFISCSTEPYLFTWQDKYDEIEGQFTEWLNQSFLAAMTEWQKRL
ncbi:MAG: Fic family protein [candidate division Zixibacteria bacterium]|nr:Fic family protein [Candidatus Tariuqbacter arcticus]